MIAFLHNPNMHKRTKVIRFITVSITNIQRVYSIIIRRSLECPTGSTEHTGNDAKGRTSSFSVVCYQATVTLDRTKANWDTERE